MVYPLKKLINFYKIAYKIRRVETRISENYSEGKMRCPVHLSVGQEGVAAAFSGIVKKKDFAVSTHRSHSHFIGKGGDLKAMIAEIYGKKDGTSSGKAGSMHLSDLRVNFMGSSPIVGNIIPIGAGLALSSLIKKENRITFVFFGDGAVEEGVFYETINFASVKKLPVIFICENNFFSVYSSLKWRQPKDRKIYKMVEKIGVKSLHGNGNDILESYEKIRFAYNQVKKNKTPYFLEFKTYRWLEHCGPFFDNHLNYRNLKEVKNWKKRDPLKILNKKILSQFPYASKILRNLEKKLDKEINKAFVYAQNSKFPAKKTAYEKVYK